jgi:hypothetical protein
VVGMKKVAFVAIALVAVLMIGSAGAYFTSQAQVPENIVRAGAVTVSTEPTSAAIVVDSIAPGTTASRTLTVVNGGALPANVVVTAAKKAGITEFWDALTCRATRAGVPLYEGPLGAMRTATMTLSPGARADLDFGIGLPAGADNALSSDYAKFTLYVDAEQVH